MTNDDQSDTGTRPDREDPAGEPADAESASADETLTRALAAIASQVREIRGQLERLASIQFDRMKLSLRSGMLWVVVGALLAAAGVTATAVGVIYLVSGAAGAFGELFDGRAWAGQLAAGAVSLLTIAAVIGLVVGRLRRRELKRMMQKYEPRKEGR